MCTRRHNESVSNYFVNGIALRKAKIVCSFAFLSAIGSSNSVLNNSAQDLQKLHVLILEKLSKTCYKQLPSRQILLSTFQIQLLYSEKFN